MNIDHFWTRVRRWVGGSGPFGAAADRGGGGCPFGAAAGRRRKLVGAWEWAAAAVFYIQITFGLECGGSWSIYRSLLGKWTAADLDSAFDLYTDHFLDSGVQTDDSGFFFYLYTDHFLDSGRQCSDGRQ